LIVWATTLRRLPHQLLINTMTPRRCSLTLASYQMLHLQILRVVLTFLSQWSLKCCDLWCEMWCARTVIVWSTNFRMLLVFATNFKIIHHLNLNKPSLERSLTRRWIIWDGVSGGLEE
jgi:hypothetical protein